MSERRVSQGMVIFFFLAFFLIGFQSVFAMTSFAGVVVVVILNRHGALAWFNNLFDERGNFKPPGGGFIPQDTPVVTARAPENGGATSNGLAAQIHPLGWVYRIRLPKETAWNADLAVTLINK